MYECILECTVERRNENLALRVIAQRRPEPADQDASISTDGCFGVCLHVCKVSEKVVVHDPFIELDEK